MSLQTTFSWASPVIGDILRAHMNYEGIESSDVRSFRLVCKVWSQSFSFEEIFIRQNDLEALLSHGNLNFARGITFNSLNYPGLSGQALWASARGLRKLSFAYCWVTLPSLCDDPTKQLSDEERSQDMRTRLRYFEGLESILNLHGLPNLSALSFVACWIEKTELNVLNRYLSSSDSIRTLKLQHCEINDESIALIVQLLQENSQITELSLSGNNIGPNSISTLTEGLCANSSLLSLDLSHNRLGNSSLNVLSSYLETNPQLTSLDISSCSLDAPGNFGSFLRTNTILRHLNVGSNSLGDDGLGDIAAGSLCDALNLNSSLQQLDVSNTGVWDDGVLFYIGILQKNRSLTSVNLSRCPMCPYFLERLGEILRSNSCLRHLQLSACGLGRDDESSLFIEAIRAAMRSGSFALETLDLTQNQFSATAGKAWEDLPIKVKL